MSSIADDRNNDRGNHRDNDRNNELRELFFESAQEILQAMNEEALRLEKHPEDLEALRGLRRSVHTLKGDAAACGFRELSHLAHEFEDVLAGENLRQSAATVETALTAADLFGEILEAYRVGKAIPTGSALRQMISKLATGPASEGVTEPAATLPRGGQKRIAAPATKRKSVRKAKTPQAKSGFPEDSGRGASAQEESADSVSDPETALIPADQPMWTGEEQVAIAQARRQAVPVYHLLLKIDSNCAMLEAALHIIRNILGKTGEVLAFAPDNAAKLESLRQIEAVSLSKIAPADLSRRFSVPGIVSSVHIQALSRLEEADPKDGPSTGAKSGTTLSAENSIPSVEHHSADDARRVEARRDDPRKDDAGRAAATSENSLRVDAERIDDVLNLVGELIIGRSMFQQTLLDFGRQSPKDPLRTRFADAFAFQSRVLNDLQRSVMKIRMVPVEQLFRRFPRLVRDTARICEKSVELVLVGQETDLDKSILDSLAEPLAHVVRNAISHGLEPPQERERAGKPPQGTLRLSAYHQGNQVVIEIADDGRGLDAEKIRAKAVARGLIDNAEAQRLTEPELLKLIFTPGFSTAEQVTEVSGRGVGLDVVQSVLHRLKGSVGVESTPGKGTTFRLRLPLTLAIIKAILFRVEQRLYAVPLNSVAEMTRVHQSEIHLVDGHEVMQLRKQVLTLVRLGRPPRASNEKLFVLVVSHIGQKLGLVVDELAGQEELVIKALDTSILSSDLISGVSILGDGRVVLILNLAAVAERRSQKNDDPGVAPWGMLLPLAELRKFEESVALATAGASAGGRQ